MFTSIIHTQEDVHHAINSEPMIQKENRFTLRATAEVEAAAATAVASWIKFFLVSLGTHNGECVYSDDYR